MDRTQKRGFAEWLFVACGLWLVGLGCYFVFVRPPLLPEDVRFMGTSAEALQAVAPRVTDWLKFVFTVMGGFIAGASVLVGYVGWALLPSQPRGATLPLALAGAATVGLMSAVNFALHSDFKWLLAIPPAVWAAAIGIHLHQGSFRNRSQA